MLAAGFIFWGLFLFFALMVVGYLLWMYRAERNHDDPDPPSLPGAP